MFKTRSISHLEKSLARTHTKLQEQNDLLAWLSDYVEENNEMNNSMNNDSFEQEMDYERSLSYLQNEYEMLQIQNNCAFERVIV